MANIKGKVERIRDNQVEGWAWHDGSSAPEVMLYIDGRMIARAPADKKRGDLKAAGIGEGGGGFVIDIPDDVRDGELHKISVKVTGAADYLNAYPLVAVLHGDIAEAPAALPSPQVKVTAPVRAEPAAVRDTGRFTATRGKARLAVSGCLHPSDLPAHLALAGQDVKVTRLDADNGFVAIFAVAESEVMPETLDINGVAAPIAGVTTAGFHGAIDGDGSDIRGHYLSLDDLTLPSGVRVRAADRATLTLPTAAGAIFDGNGAMAVSFTVPMATLLTAVQARDGHFVLAHGQTFEVAIIGDSDLSLAMTDIGVGTSVTFHLEHMTAERIVGWMVRDDDKSRYADMDMFVDGIRYATLTGDRHRQDVINAGHAVRGGGFHIMPLHPGGGEARVQFAPPFSRDFLNVKGPALALPAPVMRLDRIYAGLVKSPAVTIVIPVRNEAREARQRIETVLRYRGSQPVLVIDDASHDAETLKTLAELGKLDGVTIHREPHSIGPVAALNRGIELAGRDDICIVAPGVGVGPAWLDGLRAAAYSDARIATATPCSNNAGGFSVPETDADNALPDGLRSADAARLVRQLGAGTYPRVPVGSGFCLYIRRDCLDAIGDFDAAAFPNGGGEDIDFCLRASQAGFLHIVDDRTFVYNRRWAPAMPSRQAQLAENRRVIDARYPEYAALGANFAGDEPLRAMRWRVRKAWFEHVPKASPPKPRIAYVIATRSGGTPQTNRDLMAALSDRYEPWVIACDAHTLELMRFTAGREETVATIRLDTPLHPASHTSSDYSDAISGLLLTYGFELVHIRHLGWHGIDLPKICRALGLPVVLSLHDFYTVCPNIKLLDQDQVFCAGRCTPTPGECSVELWPQSEFPQLKHNFIYRWQEMFAAVFPSCDAIVTTSDTARDIIRAIYPALDQADFRVIPHGRSFEDVGQLAVKPQAGERLRVLVPGNISPAKGSDLINAIVALDADKRIEFHVLGDPGRVVKADTVIRHGLYRRDEFAAKVAVINPHIGAVLSIWPETYCHTLTELWASGIPVAGIDIGAVGERLRAHGGGWPVPLASDATALYQLLLATHKDWAARAAEVKAWQAGHNLHYGTAEMADAYDALYRQLWRNQLRPNALAEASNPH